MTTAAPKGIPNAVTPATPVLADRKLNPHRLTQQLSVFVDDRWDLSPGLFEAHVPTSRINFLAVPESFRHAAKYYFWYVINHDDPADDDTAGVDGWRYVASPSHSPG